MSKELFLEIIDWLIDYKCKVEDLEATFELADAFDLPFIQWDNALKYICAAAGFDDIIRYNISDLVWIGYTYIPIDPDDCESKTMEVNASEFYDFILGVKE